MGYKTSTFKILVCDFETTVYKGQQNTEVWASASVEMYTEDVHIFHSIGEQFDYFVSLDSNIIAYYHNLKFDGSFWLWYLINVKNFAQAVAQNSNNPLDVSWLKNKDMKNNTFKYAISDRGMWYTITIKVKNKIIEIRTKDILKYNNISFCFLILIISINPTKPA